MSVSEGGGDRGEIQRSGFAGLAREGGSASAVPLPAAPRRSGTAKFAAGFFARSAPSAHRYSVGHLTPPPG
ncbi:hypothetical protein, partial [Streptomyces zhihengii]|uniref:hypothetical protein n=1 Tax=Streptomyces zhihengii TaxID=1818004 RepID=UPI0033A1052E